MHRKLFKLYIIENLVNSKKYIGKTKNTLGRRWSQHKLRAKQKYNLPLYNAINKYGVQSFKITLLETFHTLDELDVAETKNILHHNTIFPNGYNMTLGGDGGDTFSKLTEQRKAEKRKKHSIFLKTHNPMHNGNVYEHWIKKYGLEKAAIMRKQHIEKIKEAKRKRRSNVEYRKLLSEKMSKVVAELRQKNGISPLHSRRLSDYNRIRYKIDELKQMFQHGSSVEDLAKHFKVGEFTITRKLQKLGLISKPQPSYLYKYEK